MSKVYETLWAGIAEKQLLGYKCFVSKSIRPQGVKASSNKMGLGTWLLSCTINKELHSSSFVSKFLQKVNNEGYFCSQKGILTTTTELFILLIQKDLVISLSVRRWLKYLEKDGNRNIYSKGNLVMAGLIDKDLNYCLFGINRNRNKNGFPGCLQCLTVARLEQNVGFDMQISFPLLSFSSKYCVLRRYKW